MSQHKQDKLNAQANELRRQSEAAFERWLKRNPEVVDCIANRKAFEAYADFSDGLTEADFDFCYSNIRSLLALQSTEQAKEWKAETLADMRAELTEKIIQLLRTGGARMTEHNLQTERTKCAYRSVAQLQARLDEIVGRQVAGKKSVPQLRTEVREATKTNVGYPDLPHEWVPPGRVRAVKVDAAFIRSLSGPTLRQWAARYGFEQINDALRERV
jgi:hypothetical protein